MKLVKHLRSFMASYFVKATYVKTYLVSPVLGLHTNTLLL